MPDKKHALLSPSSAFRWLVCTAAPRFEEGLPECTSSYAEEGRLAHAIAELKVLKKFTVMNNRTYNSKLKKYQSDPLYEPEMDKATDLYIDHLTEQAMLYDASPSVAAEVEVKYSEYAPEGSGTCDNVMFGGDTLCITDFKYGQGVPVSAKDNPQLRLYALGALNHYKPIFGDTIQKIRMSIDQPRLNSYTTEMITIEELRAWGDSIKPIAQKAFSGLGEFAPGKHCNFCRGKAQCKAHAKTNTALEDFKDCVPVSEATPEQIAQNEERIRNGASSNLLTDAEIGDLLTRGKLLVKWYKGLEAYAMKALQEGKEIPGWKLVASKSDRAFTNPDAAIKAVIEAGYEEAIIYDRKPKTLAQLEKLMGRDKFEKIVGSYVFKPLGKPALAEESDKQKPYNSAAADFAEVVQNG